ncbi:MAG TPA: DUF6049 family protein [Amycolatopsis sp.]|uniref:DUF6049 family protein n=1 Tax=Amycolatopsis sp. TaxID=37632 RepID=UPI002B49F5E0|nr:DUF6049 family protein [Amycolatopsis sp.]HKS48807.1 DUF6049 family protein [Amycolatopsis sp.]
MLTRLAALALTVLFAGLSAPPAIAQQNGESQRLKLNITQLTPRVINNSATTLTIAGTVTNIGDRRISDLQVRLELGSKLTTERQLRSAMTGAVASPESMSKFVEIQPSVLAPGQTGQLNVTVKLDGSANNLRISSAGIYPLLVNVNGTPDYGRAARLSPLSLLLPVVGAPGRTATQQPPSQPAPVTMLWPIADARPRVVAAPYSGTTVLGDDVLAGELRPGGRLDALVSSALSVRNDPELARSLCYAIDPDLLDTVDAMSRGYDVRTPAGNVPGSGVEVAKTWLASLRTLVANQCVIQLPYADADLSALAKVRNGDLMTYALGQRVQPILGVRPMSGVIWADGSLSAAALNALAGAGVTTVVANPSDLESQVSGGVVVGGNVRAEPVDSLVSTGLGGATGSAPTASTPVDDPAIGAQNGLAALAFRGGLGTSASSGKPVLVAPPRRWDVPQAELTRLLQTFNDFLDRRMLTAAPLTQLLAANTTGDTTMNYTTDDAATATPAAVTDEMAAIENTMADLRGAMTVDSTAQVDPEQLLLPLRYALVRNCSTAWRTTRGAAEMSANDSRTELDALLRRVTVDTPAVPISMASGSAPLPVFLRNTLPVQIAVRISVNNNAGLRVGDTGIQLLPAALGRPVQIEAEALRAGKFSVTVNLSTPDGTPLGNPARFELRSNEYGVVTLVLTIAGGAALVLLSGRQIYRRLKARKAG